MLTVHGYYRFRPKIVAFRNDYCLTCNAPRRAVWVRTFNVWHLWWIPLVPLGFWKKWRCTSCGFTPGYNPRSRRKFALTLAALAAAFAAIFWSLPVQPDQASMWMFIRRVAPVVMVASLGWAFLAERTPSTAERLADVSPAQDTTCPLCEGALTTNSWKCETCGIERK